MLSTFRKTPAAATELGRSYFEVFNLVRFGKIASPKKDSSGHYIWTDADIANARKVLEEKSAVAVR